MLARYREQLPLIDGAVEAVERLGGALSARGRVVVEPAADRRGARVAGLAPYFARDRLVRGGRAREARAGRLPRGGATARRRRRTRCAAVEDSHGGIRSAKAAGMRVIAIPNPSYPPDEEALAQADVDDRARSTS